MGTVGLSFGSPTSGAGFNVSQTVSQIVAGLQNIETPWKTQLSSLQSQDTVISSLGTLMSNLSNDLSQLTDFTGVLAQKTGSSSDNNVLELTSATSAAMAGTHSIVVNRLATSASGYLTEVPSASTTLSGSFYLSVGSGASVKIDTANLTDKSLAGVANAINNSGVGITASVLTDSSGSRLSLVSGTSGMAGNINISNNTLSANSGPAMNYTASSSSNTTGTLTSVASASDPLSLGSVSIQVGSNAAQTITLTSSNNTLTGLMNAINSTMGSNVAAIQTDSTTGVSTLVLTSPNGQPLTVGTSGLYDTATTSTPLAYTSSQTGVDASLTVDGVNLTSSSNTVTNLIPGLTFQLLGVSPTQSSGSPESVQVVIGNNTTSVESAIASMVTDYNSLVSAMHAQEGNNSSGTPQPLFGSPTLSLLQQELMSALNTSNASGSLSTIESGATLTGTVTITSANGTQTNFTMGSTGGPSGTIYTGGSTLADLQNAINAAGLGYTAGISTTTGQDTLSLYSAKNGASGALSVTSTLSATNPDATVQPMTYIASSDITTLASLGISVSTNYDGTISLDGTTLYSLLNSDFNSVVGFFQSMDSWGQKFTNTLNNSGNTSSKGILTLAANANSSVEASLNSKISSQNRMISVQQASITAELNSANEILQGLPTQLQGVNEIYSAISGYNSNSNG